MSVHEAILLAFEQLPEKVDYYFIPANSKLSENMIGAILVMDGLIINTDECSPETEQQWKAWEYLNAAVTTKEEHLCRVNKFNQNRFYAKLVPYALKFGEKYPAFSVENHFRLVRTGIIL